MPMASLQVQIEAVRQAVMSTSSCTPTTVVSLKSLLLPPEEQNDAKTASSTSRAASRSAQSRPNTSLSTTRPGTAASKRRPATATTITESRPVLSPKEKTQLATHVINATLKSLAEAAKPRPQQPASNTSEMSEPPKTPARVQQLVADAGEDAPPRTAARKGLRRSVSAPMTPLQPRTLNRVATSPLKPPATAAATAVATTCLATIECARVAFLALREIQETGHVTLPDLQLEAGMSSFVAKLLGLNMLDHACRELQVLKSRLQAPKLPSKPMPSSLATAVARPKTTAKTPKESREHHPATETVTGTSPGDLLDYGDVSGVSLASLRLIVASQLQALRILAALKKPAYVDVAHSFLLRSCPSSPLHSISRCIRAGSLPAAEQQKALRQLETLSQLLLALTPSIASKDDVAALEPKLSISPSMALGLQALSLEARLLFWKFSGHDTRADVDKDIMTPLARCLSTYARRGRASGRLSYSSCRRCFDHIYNMLQSEQQLAMARTSRSPLANIYQTLCAAARETGHLSDAISCARELCSLIRVDVDSAARCCSASAQLLSLELKSLETADMQRIYSRFAEVLDAIKGPLKGDTAELEELLLQVCQVRKAAMNLLISKGKQTSSDHSLAIPEPTHHLMEAFIYQCPRFCLRWLGKPPAAKSSATKDFLRYEQRRQLLSQSIRPTLDSSFVVTKTMIEDDRMAWDQLDSVLSDALTLLEYLGDLKSPAKSAASSDAAALSYYVKISHFYYLSYNALRRSKESETDALRSLRRAIDCVKHRSSAEKDKAQLIPKLERMADLCKSMGQIGEALGALQTIRTSLVDDLAVSAITTRLHTQSPRLAWTADDQAEALSRTLVAISRLEQVPIDWTGGLEDDEQVAVLEHQLYFICLGDRKTGRNGKGGKAGRGETDDSLQMQRLSLTHPCIDSLLRFYYPTRFPVRRLRTLLQVFTTNLDDPDVLADVTPQVDAVLGLIDSQDLGDDASLSPYIPHYRALAHSLAGFSHGYRDSRHQSSLETSLAIWKGLIQEHPQRAELEQVIDGLGDLQVHLQAVGEFMRAMGRDTVLTTVLELSSLLCGVLSSDCQPREEGNDRKTRVLVAQDALLASHYVRIGECLKAEQILGRVGGHLEAAHESCDLAESVASFHLSYAEYLIAVGRIEEAHVHLLEAEPSGAILAKFDGSQRKILRARASLLQSIVALERGYTHLALQSARGGVRTLFHDWSHMEKLWATRDEEAAEAEAENSSMSAMTTTMITSSPAAEAAAAQASDSTVDMSEMGSPSAWTTRITTSPEFWTLFHPLFDNMLRLSSIYAHLGMFQETLYYAEQAQKIAAATSGALSLAQAEAWLGTVWLRAGQPDKALELATTARSRMSAMDQTSRKAALACELSSLCRQLKDEEGEEEMIALSEAIVEQMSSIGRVVETGEERDSEPATVVEAKTRKTRAVTTLAMRPKTLASTRAAMTTTRRKAAAPKSTKKSAAVVASKPASTPAPTSCSTPASSAENSAVMTLRSAIMVNKVLSLVDSKDWSSALAILRTNTSNSAGEANDTVMTPGWTMTRAAMLVEQVALAACLMGQSTEQMARDAVFSVIQDSTLSFPAVSTPTAAVAAAAAAAGLPAGAGGDFSLDGLSLTKSPSSFSSPMGTPKSSATSRMSGRAALSFVDSLLEAQSRLIHAQVIAVKSGDASTLHRISSMLQSAVITLSAMSSNVPRAMSHPAYATCSVELARNMTWRRERHAIMVERRADTAQFPPWLAYEEKNKQLEHNRRCSLEGEMTVADISRFQREYIDIIPRDWSVVSLALTDNNQDLCITKLQSGESPFVVRLPLERAISRDADTEVFSFQQGRSELLEIIAATNASCHDARDMTVNGAKSAWWAERSALDGRLRELLDNVEQIWLGGFRGIFSQHVRQPGPFSRFQKSFQTILNKHLPSRRTIRSNKRGAGAGGASTRVGKQKVAAANASSHRVSLDARTLDLFIGLGDATEEDCDFDDALNDLLYFVVDILQFHGEHNAYDEIDFDTMGIETFDALYAYHAAAAALREGPKNSKGGRAGDGTHPHTILVLDKALHVFPWEVMPCLRGSPVSRVPSLACLRRLLVKEQQTEESAEDMDNQDHDDGDDTFSEATTADDSRTKPSGHQASAMRGAYMLNPSGDLTSTQATFDGPLSASVRGSWTRIVGRAPTEEEFTDVLRDKDVLLYFGHGSGAQYIRGRTVRKLEKCRATALLMGCSSAGLDYNGAFELQGPVWNYMLAGCPAVVGTLWDVTDKDIDRFAGRTFEEWGLLPQGSFSDNTAAAADKEERSGGRIKRQNKAMSAGKKGSSSYSSSNENRQMRTSLVEAVMRAREATRFRYLTAAAVCVYGIPVYLKE